MIDSGNKVEVLAPGGSNVGTLKNLVTNEEFDLVDYAGGNSNTFQCKDDNKCSGWVNHSGAPGHVSASDWRFVIGEPNGEPPIPEPNSAVLFGLGALVFRTSLRRRA